MRFALRAVVRAFALTAVTLVLVALPFEPTWQPLAPAMSRLFLLAAVVATVVNLARPARFRKSATHSSPQLEMNATGTVAVRQTPFGVVWKTWPRARDEHRFAESRACRTNHPQFRR